MEVPVFSVEWFAFCEFSDFGKLLPGHFHAICPLAESTRRLIFIELEASYILQKFTHGELL